MQKKKTHYTNITKKLTHTQSIYIAIIALFATQEYNFGLHSDDA